MKKRKYILVSHAMEILKREYSLTPARSTLIRCIDKNRLGTQYVKNGNWIVDEEKFRRYFDGTQKRP